MAAVSLFWDTNMAAVTSCENTLLTTQPLTDVWLIFVRDEQNSIVNVNHIKGVTIFYDDGAL